MLGTVRSGTTKLAEALASARTTRLVFEPLNPMESPWAPDGFLAGCHLPPEGRDAALHAVWTRVLTGRLRSPWTDSRNRARVATRRVVKCVAANNLAGWLRHRFPHTPIVFVHRHPLAVAESIVNLETHARERGASPPFPWTHRATERLATESGLLDGPLLPVRDGVRRLLDGDRTVVVDHVLRWCLENYVPLTMPSDPGFLVARYEDVVDRPDEQLRRIGRFAALGVDRGVRDFDRPSSTDWATGLGDRDGSRRNRRDGWRARLAAGDRDAADAVIATFGLGRCVDER